MRSKSRVIVIGCVGALMLAGCSTAGGGNGSASPAAGGSTDTIAAGTTAIGGSTTGAPATGVPATGGSTEANTGKPIDVMGWSVGDEVGTSRVAYAKKQDPALDIVPDKNGFDQQTFATAMAAGSAPAGVSMDRQLIATYAAKGFLEPLDNCIAADHIDMGQYYPASVQESTWGGHVYGVPEFYTTRGVYLNLDALKGAGLTAHDVDTANWSSLQKLADDLYRTAGGKPSRIGFDPKLPEYLPLWTMAAGGNIVDGKGAPTLDSPAVVSALTWAVKVIDAQGGWAKFKSFRDSWDFFGGDNEFVKDQIGVMPFEQWYVNVLAGTRAAKQFTVIPFFAQNGSELTFESGSAFAIPKGSPNAGGMCEAMKVLTSTGAWMAAGAAREQKVQKDHSAFTGIFSANKTANDELRTTYVKPTGNKNLDTAIATFYDTLDSAKMIPPSPAGQQIQDAYQQAVTSALGGTSAQAALTTAQATAMQAYQDATS